MSREYPENCQKLSRKRKCVEFFQKVPNISKKKKRQKIATIIVTQLGLSQMWSCHHLDIHYVKHWVFGENFGLTTDCYTMKK